MSKVEWKRLGDVCCFKKGQMITLKTAIKGSVPVISSGQQPSFYHNCANRNGETIVVAGSGAYAGFVSYWDTPIFVADAFSVSPKNLQTIIVKYLFYYLQNNQETIYHTKTTGGIPHVYSRFIENYIIPIPPKHIQQQIVNQLDIFTTLIAKLESELTLRQKQYEFYREELLNFDGDEEVEWKTLGEIGEVSTCKRIFKNQTYQHGEIPFYKIGTFGKIADSFISKELYLEYKSKYSFPKKGTILISASGSIGRTVVYNGEDAYFQDSNIVWIDNDESVVLNTYLKLFYSITKWVVDDGGVISRLYNRNLKATIIPVPPMHRQQQIVSQLDTFTTLIDKLEREIALRQKQYEFYREKLLTFE